MSFRFRHLDVFTSRPLEGNQLAVFPEPPHTLSTALMQRIAAEMNFSESTFIFPPRAGGDVHMRIFTPAQELPIAGHPTIGSTFALADEGVIAPGRETFVFELGVGPTPVALEWTDGRLAFAWMTQPRPAFAAPFDAGRLAEALGLEPGDTPAGAPAQVVSCGVPYLLVPLASREAVDRVMVDRRGYAEACRRAGATEEALFVFTTARGPDAGDETVYGRMLAPMFGITEDPATGSAAGPLGCYLVRHGAIDADRARGFVCLQGVAMGRPSRLHIAIEASGTDITRVRVGGQAVEIGRGELNLDNS